MQKNDVYHVSVAGINPHSMANDMDDTNNPFHDEAIKPTVAQQIINDGSIVGGTVEVWAHEHLTPAQENYLNNHPHVVDVRHVWPDE